MKNEAFEQKNDLVATKNPFPKTFSILTALEMIYLRNYAEAHFQTFQLQIAFV